GHPGGGWGAKFDEDGVSATVALNDGDTHNSPIEATEAKSPIIVEERALRQDSAGPGKFRGGLGVTQRVHVRKPATIDSRMERTIGAPWGLHGGGSALANRIGRLSNGDTAEKLPTGKGDTLALDCKGQISISELIEDADF